jgi:hypothetical protein
MEDFRARVKRAIEKNLEKGMRKNTPQKKRTNKKPEDLVRRSLYLWLKDNGFYPFVVEAKAVWSHDAGRYLTGQVEAGTSDILAVSPTGLFVAVEVKAKGRRSTLKGHQRQFLLQAIQRGGFASCSDSVEHLQDLYYRWKLKPSKELLIQDLPKEKEGPDLLFD